MFFKEMEALLAQTGGSGLNLCLARTPGGLTVVLAVSRDKDAPENTALARPLHIEATASELDAGFSQAIATWTPARVTLQEQVAAEVVLLNAETKASAVRAAKPSQKKPEALAAPKGTSQSKDDESGDDDDLPVVPVSAPKAAPTRTLPEVQDTLELDLGS